MATRKKKSNTSWNKAKAPIVWVIYARVLGDSPEEVLSSEIQLASSEKLAHHIAHMMLIDYYQTLMKIGWEQDQPVTGYRQLKRYLGVEDNGYYEIDVTGQSVYDFNPDER